MKRLSAFIAMLCLLYPNVHNAFAHSGGTDSVRLSRPNKYRNPSLSHTEEQRL